MNSYNSLFYMAFIKRSVEGCKNNDCGAELRNQVTIIFIVAVLKNFMEVCEQLMLDWTAIRIELAPSAQA